MFCKTNIKPHFNIDKFLAIGREISPEFYRYRLSHTMSTPATQKADMNWWYSCARSTVENSHCFQKWNLAIKVFSITSLKRRTTTNILYLSSPWLPDQKTGWCLLCCMCLKSKHKCLAEWYNIVAVMVQMCWTDLYLRDRSFSPVASRTYNFSLPLWTQTLGDRQSTAQPKQCRSPIINHQNRSQLTNWRRYSKSTNSQSRPKLVNPPNHAQKPGTFVCRIYQTQQLYSHSGHLQQWYLLRHFNIDLPMTWLKST